VLHILLLIVTTAQVYMLLGDEIHDSQATIELFYQLFQADDETSGGDLIAIGSTNSIYSIDNLQSAV
jgi:hypothetical protein